MKKRRELDALVNGKTNGRRKRKGQHDLLLENMSDSSEIEEFSIPGKTVVRKRGFCSFCATCVTLCGFFMLVACVSAIVGLIWVHIELKQELDDLKYNINQVQSSNQGTPAELSTLRAELAELSQALNDLQSAEDENGRLVAEQNNRITQTEEHVTNIENEVKEKAPPGDLNRIKQEQAKFGSDLVTLQEDINNLKNFQTDINGRFDDLQKTVTQLISAGTSHNDDTHSQPSVDVMQRLNALEVSIDSANVSLSSRLVQIAEIGRQNEGNIETLREKSQELDNEITLLKVSAANTPSPDNESPEHSTTPPGGQSANSAVIEGLIQNALQNYSLGGSSFDVQTYNSSIQTQISDILTRLNGVEGQDIVTGEVFFQYKNTAQAQYQNINQSVSQLQTSTSELRSLVEEHHLQLAGIDSKLANAVTVQVGDSSQENSTNDKEDSNPSEKNPSDGDNSDITVNGPGEQGVGAGGQEDENAEVVGTTKKMLIGGDDGHLPEWLQLATTEETPTGSDWSTGVMYNEAVTTAKDVELEFYKWDSDGDGFVQYTDVSMFYGPNMPSEADLNRFDTDGDNRYNLAEMQAAFGFQQPTEEQPGDDLDEAPPAGEFPSGIDEGTEESLDRQVRRARQHLTDDKDRR